MRNLEEAAATWTLGALVFVRQPGTDDDLIRPAAFVYATEDGLAWVEPSYAEPLGTPTPALHRRAGSIEAEGRGFVLRTATGEAVTVLPYEEDDRDLVGDALEWFAQHLADSGLQFDAERERVRELIAD